MKMLKGEFEKQLATIILYPYRNDIWRKNCHPAQDMIIELANAIAQFQDVILGVIPNLVDEVKGKYQLSCRVKVVPVLYDDCWARDSISSVLVDNECNKCVNAFGFNAYGGELYADWSNDARLNETILQNLFGYDVKHWPVTLEWGNITPDGNGTIFVVEDSIVNNNRNPGMTKEQITQCLLEATNSKQVVWLEQGLDCDETGGHIDNVLAFADKNTMIVSFTDDKSNAHYERTRKIYKFLQGVKNAEGKPYKIVKLPVPTLHERTIDESDAIVSQTGSFERKAGDSILYTYVNFAIINDGIIVPAFGLPEDEIACKVLQEVFPDRKIVPMDAREAFLGGGGFHCLTKHVN